MSTETKTIAEKLIDIADNVPKVYEAGKKAEYDAFWDRFQASRDTFNSSITGTFNGRYWGFDNFYPKYDIKPVGGAGQYLFYAWENTYGDNRGSLKQRLEECGVVLDTSQATNLYGAFAYGRFTELPTIDCSLSASSSALVFGHCAGLETIEKIIVSENVSFTNWFLNDSGLMNIAFEGMIGQDIDFRYSKKLSADSIRSIITHLSDTAQGKTLTLSRTAVDTAIANGEFGGDIVYMTTDGAFSEYLYSNPIPLSKGQTIKITFDMEEGHDFYSDGTTDWWFGSAGLTAAGGTPNHKSGWTWTATQDDEQVVLMWYFDSKDAVSNIPIKTRAVLVDEDGNELTGENLNSFAADTVPNNGTTLTIADESWETLQASKPNWTISLV